ncbi:DUF4232 domain-containing protein [Pseudonocardiaceae bacterium YIM PH 21723]|nr:DUF4232 domain-containing protein [Pseudonocardiaceae bacterium YIM PH 21723]
MSPKRLRLAALLIVVPLAIAIPIYFLATAYDDYVPVPDENCVAWKTENVQAPPEHLAYKITMQNCGSASFTLNSYPKIELFDDAQYLVPVEWAEARASFPELDKGPTPLIIKPKELASTTLIWPKPAGEPTPNSHLVTHMAVAPPPGANEDLLETMPEFSLPEGVKVSHTAWRDQPNT